MWNAGGTGDVGLAPELRGYPGGGHGNPLQYSCLENSMERGAWWAIVHGVTKSWTRLEWLNTHTHPGLEKTRNCECPTRLNYTDKTRGKVRPRGYLEPLWDSKTSEPLLIFFFFFNITDILRKKREGTNRNFVAYLTFFTFIKITLSLDIIQLPF